MNTGNKEVRTTNSQRLTIRVGTPADAFEKLENRFSALDRGERPEPLFELVFQNEADVHRVISPKQIDLLRTIARQAPSSIRETARLVDRDVRQVHDNLTKLEQLDLVKFERDGRSKRPLVWYDELEIIVPITDQPSSEHSLANSRTSSRQSGDPDDWKSIVEANNSPDVSQGSPKMQTDNSEASA